MKKILKFLLVCLLCLLGAGLLYGLYAIVYPWMTEFRPPDRITVFEDPEAMENPISDTTFRILTWNIGYAGLGREMDFFYEGGRMVRPGREQTQEYLDGILGFLKSNRMLDFILIQEVDFRSKRSYRINEYDSIRSALDGYHSVSAVNYQSAFVPSPLREPMGRVKAGQATFSRATPSASCRIATPGAYPWPVRLFMLKRCFLVSRYPVAGGRELVLFNIHNSAFDDAGSLRQQELELLRKMALEEFAAGHHVVIGGDWNQNPPGWKPPAESRYQVQERWPIEPDYMPAGWTWAYDPGQPTNRNVNTPFDPNESICTALDFFLVSPNVRVEQTEALDLGFQFSDHQPVVMKFTLLH